MQLGHRTLFDSLFPKEPSNHTSTVQVGRSADLIALRNELLIHRYYYFARIKRMQYQDCLAALEVELFIAERTIINTMNDNRLSLKELSNKKPELHYFKKKYPHLVW